MTSMSSEDPTLAEAPHIWDDSDRLRRRSPASSEATASGSKTTNQQGNSSDSSNTAPSSGNANNDSTSEGAFECNICLDTAKDAVVSFCGHLFCWPCLHQWLATRPSRQTCPVCKASISRDKVIPLYGRGGGNKDPREKLPPRPPGQRTEPEPVNASPFHGFGLADGGFHMSFGIGAFPFGFFASTFNFGDFAGRPPPSQNAPEYAEDQFLSRLFLWVGIVFIFWLLIA